MLTVAGTSAVYGELVTITIDGDRVTYSPDERYVSVQGNARIVAQSEEDAARRVTIEANTIEGDLVKEVFEAAGHVFLVTAQGSMRGASLHYEASTSEFELQDPAVMVGLREVEGRKVCGFAYGRRVEKHGDRAYIFRGRVTTCDRVPPHFALEFRSAAYDTSNKKLTVRGGALRIYGLKVPLLPRASFDLGKAGGGKPSIVPLPSYSRREGLYLRWNLPLASPDSATDGNLHLRLTSKRGLIGRFDAQRPWGSWTGHLVMSRAEDVSNDLDELVSVDRLPEFSIGREWDSAMLGGTQISGGLTLGHYREDRGDGGPEIRDGRALAEFRIARNYGQWAEGEGTWWWAGARQAWYDSGDECTDLDFGVGAGTELPGGMTSSLTLRHHELGGRTPFEFDDVDLRTELIARTQAPLGGGWDLGLSGRWDLRADDLRDYELKLSKRVHCLTWVAGYRDVGERISVGVEVNGLWGNARPYSQRSIEEGPPDGGDEMRDARGGHTAIPSGEGP